MYVDKRKDRAGQVYFSFSYLDKDGKRRRLKKSEHPHFATLEEAQSWARGQQAIYASKKNYIAQKLAWKTQYYNFNELIDLYTGWSKGEAPNSWQAAISYLNNWVFPFFLNEKKSGNVNNWHLHYQEFRDWLTKPDLNLKGGKKTNLALSTANSIIKTLNTFTTCLAKYNKMDREVARIKCEAFEAHKLARRSLKDIIPPDEMKAIHARMHTIHPPAADFFLVLWHTGMRFNELFSLPITALYKGQMTNKSFHDELSKCGIDYVGYIYLDSQAEHDDRKREEDKAIKRKPLKGLKEIHPRNARTIPIRTPEVWNVLARRHKVALESFVKKEFGGDKSSYVFFEDLEWNKAYNALKTAYSDLGIDAKQFHCCRHTFTTLLVGETRSFFLTRAITGHRVDRTFERYLHIYEQIGLAAQQNEQVIEEIG